MDDFKIARFLLDLHPVFSLDVFVGCSWLIAFTVTIRTWIVRICRVWYVFHLLMKGGIRFPSCFYYRWYTSDNR